jgi:hypothetical protein
MRTNHLSLSTVPPFTNPGPARDIFINDEDLRTTLKGYMKDYKAALGCSEEQLKKELEKRKMCIGQAAMIFAVKFNAEVLQPFLSQQQADDHPSAVGVEQEDAVPLAADGATLIQPEATHFHQNDAGQGIRIPPGEATTNPEASPRGDGSAAVPPIPATEDSLPESGYKCKIYTGSAAEGQTGAWVKGYITDLIHEWHKDGVRTCFKFR